MPRAYDPSEIGSKKTYLARCRLIAGIPCIAVAILAGGGAWILLEGGYEGAAWLMGSLSLVLAAVGSAYLRARVVADDQGVTIYGWVRSRRVPWKEVAGFMAPPDDVFASLLLRDGSSIRVHALWYRASPVLGSGLLAKGVYAAVDELNEMARSNQAPDR